MVKFRSVSGGLTLSFVIQRLNLQKLTHRERDLYRTFLDKFFWPCLKGLDPWGISTGEIFGVSVTNTEGALIGLAMAVYYRYTSLAQILSLRVKEASNEDTIYELLLNDLMSLFREQNCLLLTSTYSSLAPNASNLASLFKKIGGGNPQLLIVRCHFDLQAFNPKWFNRYQRIQLPPEIEFLPWKKLTLQEHKQLAEREEQGEFSASVSPFYEEKKRDANRSLVARFQGEIIGWINLHRIASDTIQFSTFYVERNFRASKVPGYLLVHSIALAQQAKIPKAIFEFNLGQVDQHWIDFVKKRLAPYAQQVERIFEVGIELQKPHE